MPVHCLQEAMPGFPRRRMTSEQRSWLLERLAGMHIGVAGATGAVGRETLALLEEAGVPTDRIMVSGSSRSVGTRIPYANEELTLVPLADFETAHGAVLATPASLSKDLAPWLARCGVVVSDNSSALRKEAPLIIPEVNAHAAPDGTRIIASPNCTTTITLTAVEGIRNQYGFASIEIVSYQSVSGAGLKAMNALIAESSDAASGVAIRPRWLGEPIAFSVFPHESPIDPDTGLCAEAQKFVSESARILDTTSLVAAATCVRVPTLRTHTVAVRIETLRPCDRTSAIEAIQTAEGVEMVRQGPTSHTAIGRCRVLAGLPTVTSTQNAPGTTVRLLIAGDQLLKGAAWNALQNLALIRHRQ